MLPIATLPAAGLLLRLGQADMLGAEGLAAKASWLQPVADIFSAAGGAVFDNLPLIFAVGVAVGFAKKADGSTGVAALFGFLYAPLVITGVHQTTLAIDMQMIQSMGGTPVWPLIALSNIAQASAVVGIIIASRKQHEREISVPAAISAYLGVTEPAMYGINLKYRFPMLCAMIGSGLAGLLCGLNGVLANGIGVGGLPGILSIQPTYWQVYAMAMAIAVVVPIILTTVVYQRKYRQGTLQSV